MIQESIIPLLLGILFIGFYGLLSGAQRALFAITEDQIEHLKETGDPRSRFLGDLLSVPRRTALSLLIAKRLCLLGAVVSAQQVWLLWNGGALLGVLLVGAPLLIFLLGMGLSRAVTRRGVSLYASHMAFTVWILERGISPLSRLLHRCTSLVLNLGGIPHPRRDEEALEREYLGLVDIGHREGVVESDEHRLIHRVFEFAELPVSKVMTPRAEMFTLPVHLDLDEVIRRVHEAGYSRVPVHRGKKDEVVGILYAKDLLRLRLPEETPRPRSVEELLRPAHFVSAQMGVEELFRDLQRRKLHMAICVDEYGGVAGLVTMEDLLEELFGEIYDEFDLEIRRWEPVEEGVYMVSGRMALDELARLLQVPLEEEDCQTVAGWVLKLFGRLPEKGESIEWDGLRVVVEKVSGTRIQAVRIERRLREGA